MKFRPGSSEDEGHYVDLTFTILETESGTYYKKFKVAKEDWNDPTFAKDLPSAGS